MSFPSSIIRTQAGDTPEAAMLFAMEHDTPLGFQAILASSTAPQEDESSMLGHVRNTLPPEVHKDVLRAEHRGDGVVIDFDPLSDMGRQISRLMGTDAARPLLEERFETHLGFGNCCKVLVSKTASDVIFTVKEQIDWQYSIDC